MGSILLVCGRLHRLGLDPDEKGPSMSATHLLHVDEADIQFHCDHGYFIYHHSLFPEEKF